MGALRRHPAPPGSTPCPICPSLLHRFTPPPSTPAPSLTRAKASNVFALNLRATMGTGRSPRRMAQEVGQPRTRLGKSCSRGRPGSVPVMLGDRACLTCQDHACCHRGPVSPPTPSNPHPPPAPAMGVTWSQGQSSLQAGHCTGQDRSPASCLRTPPVARATAHKKTRFYSIERGSGVWRAVKWILRTLCLRSQLFAQVTT